MLNIKYKELLTERTSNVSALIEYFDFIESILSKKRVKVSKLSSDYVYYESHHILPKSLFPELAAEKDNQILLTAREHFIAHKLLFNAIPCQKMGYALWKMACCNRNIASVTDEEYEQAKLIYISQEHWNKGRVTPEDVKIKISSTLKQRYEKIPYIMTEEHHQKSVQTRKNNNGYQRSSEQNKKTSDALKGRIFVNNRIKNKRIYPDELKYYLDNGWIRGKKPLSEEHKKNIGIKSKGHEA